MAERNPHQLPSVSQPPGPLRNAELRELVASLSLQDIRELSRILSECDFRRDIISMVHTELRDMIAEYFDLATYVAALRVSKRWRTLLLVDGMIHDLAPRFLPGFSEYYKLKNPGIPRRDFFARMTTRYSIRQSGKFQSSISYSLSDPIDDTPFSFASEESKSAMAVYPLHGSGDSKELPSFVHLYKNGRIAWQSQSAEDPRIVVDNLHTQLRTVYLVSQQDIIQARRDGDSIEIMALGDKLLVARSERTWYAWKLETREHDTIQTFNQGDRQGWRQVTTVGMRVVIQTTATEYVIWTFGHGTVTVDMTSYCQRNRPPDVEESNSYDRGIVLHPLLDNVYFFAFAKHPGLTIFYEFTDRILTGTYPSASAGFDPSCLSPDEFFKPKLLRPKFYASLFGDVKYDERIHETNHGTCHFNIFTKTFTVRRYRCPTPSSHNLVDDVWEGQLLVWPKHDHWRQRERYANRCPADGPVLVCFNSTDCPSEMDDSTPPPIYARELGKPPGPDVRRRTTETSVEPLDTRRIRPGLLFPPPKRYRPDYYLMVCDYPCLPDWNSTNKEVWQDEEFIVAEYGGTITVWSFFTDLVTTKIQKIVFVAE